MTLSSSWDSRRRLSGQTLRSSRTVLQQRAYSYRADGCLTGVEDRLNGRRTFDIDAVGRVTAVRAANWTETYAYDPAGNITSADWPATEATGAALGTRSYDGSQLTAAGRIRYEYDGAGRIVLRQKVRLSRKPDTWRYTWDAEDRLTEVTTPDGTRWRYVYDPFGRRIAKQRLDSTGTAVAERTDFTWDGPVLAEQTTRAADLPAPHTLTWDHRGLRPIAQSESIATAAAVGDGTQEQVDRRFFAIVTDLVGTPTELVDPVTGTIAWRAATTLWGNTSWPSSSTTYTPLRFPGQYFDPETRLHYNLHRYYDPETARYASPDPLGLAPAPNPDTYVRNPHVWTDPLGLSPHPGGGGPDPVEAGEQIGRATRGVPRGSGQLSHIANEVTALGFDQRGAADATDAAARTAFGSSGGVWMDPLPNGNLAVLPTQFQVGAWFEVDPAGTVVPRRGSISLNGFDLVLTPR
ncbi:hypothetical protein KCH_59270 [Kitasatospora cheerisanensis KCTC 2395]|uniref:Teneurin-like YD-shell domain-containing protein n=1 Tax=Kitasatospora cheerisanensis KCTC 2395 TaxID=1348663 RepID=A0A066YWV2_9ACTN|nr:RHS repeat-associated core domain-containing protein [Kitasatospora cheerisanensis]KDN82420.1 hypothetical protein KCH_59270 [Kitasatospora cheerisanensis KCTC 2395]